LCVFDDSNILINAEWYNVSACRFMPPPT